MLKIFWNIFLNLFIYFFTQDFCFRIFKNGQGIFVVGDFIGVQNDVTSLRLVDYEFQKLRRIYDRTWSIYSSFVFFCFFLPQ